MVLLLVLLLLVLLLLVLLLLVLLLLVLLLLWHLLVRRESRSGAWRGTGWLGRHSWVHWRHKEWTHAARIALRCTWEERP